MNPDSETKFDFSDQQTKPVLKSTEVQYECQTCWVLVPASNIEKHLGWHYGGHRVANSGANR